MKVFLEAIQSTPCCLHDEYLAACPVLLAVGIIIGRGIGNAFKSKKQKFKKS